MRTFLKIFVTFVVLAGGFAAYLIWQPPSAVQTQAGKRVAPQTLQRGEGGLIGEGYNAWVRQFDEEGRLASRFRAEKWEPEKNGLVRVIRPEAELILKGGKDKDGKEKPRPRVTIRGDHGQVVVESLPDAAAADKPLQSTQGVAANAPKGQTAGPAQPPSSGRLNGVVIEVFEKEDDPEPRVTLRTDNIVFDNDTFRISTESYEAADGTTVPPDQVEVTVTGPDFEFYGRGLTIRWNDLEERLDLLRIAHGDRLVIKNVEAFNGAGGLPIGLPKARPQGAAQAAATAALDVRPAWGLLASADAGAALALAAANRRDRGAAGDAAAPTSKPARRKKDGEKSKENEQPPYRAAFNDNVRVVQGEQQVALARLMNIDFLPGEREPERAATRPATGAATTAPAATQAAPSAPEDAASTQPAATQSAASQPSTAPAAEPVTVYWTGELTVTPVPAPAAAPSGVPATAPSAPTRVPGGAEEPLPPGEARIELVGSPAVLSRDQLHVETARFVFRTDGRLALDNSEEFPRVLITQRPAEPGGADTIVSTEAVTYAKGEQLATLWGDSRVVAPIGGGDDAGATADLVEATWNDTATFRLVGEGDDELWVERAALAGSVQVKAPQGIVRSGQLELLFDPPAQTTDKAEPAAQPATRPASTATAETAGRSKASQTPNLRRVVATDNVHCEFLDAQEGRRVLECQRLALDTARSTDGELYPRVIDASGMVHAATSDQELHAGHVLLELRPAKLAASTGAATRPATQPTGTDAAEPLPFEGRGQWALADAAAAGLAGATRPKQEQAPAFELESMTATDAVRVASKDGGVATGKRLRVTVGHDGAPRVELTGEPARVEHVRGGGTLTGPRIEVDPKSGVAHVVGAGTLRAVQREEPDSPGGVLADVAAVGAASATAPARPVEVTWADGAEVRGADNRIDITGAVSLWLTDTDGSVRTATAGRVSVELAQKAPGEQRTAPAGDAAPRRDPAPSATVAPDDTNRQKRPAPDAKPASGSQFAGSLDMDLFEGKELARVHLYDNAAVNSKLFADDGSILQQFHLRSQVITFDARTRHLSVPGPGQMLVEVHEPSADEAEPKQANAGDGNAAPAKDEAALLAGGEGVTAFQWAQSLEYDEAAGRAAMEGSVVVSHQADDKSSPLIRVDAETLAARFERRDRGAEGAEKAGAGKPAAQGAPEPKQTLQLRAMTARGNILISRDGAELSAHEISYDPSDEWVIARGTGRNPATFTAPGGAGTTRAGELWLNTKTWAVKVRDVNTRVGGLGR